MEFYKAAWPVIGKDFVIAVQSFFLHGFMPRIINATLLSLVPNTTDDEKLTDFRRIACCNVISSCFDILEITVDASQLRLPLFKIIFDCHQHRRLFDEIVAHLSDNESSDRIINHLKSN